MMRVAFPFVGDTIGGSHVSSALLMQALPKFGFSPVALLHRDGPLAGYLTDRGIAVERIALPHIDSGDAGWRAIARLAVVAPRLAARLRRGGFALAHANDGRMIASWMPAARLAGIAGIAHRRTRWTPSRLAHLSLRAARRIVAISEFVRAGLPPDLAARACVIENPFAPAAAPGDAERWSDDPARPVVGFVGTLQAQKRPKLFIDAARRVLESGVDAQFVLLGRDGECGAALRSAVAQEGRAERITFAGFRENAASAIAGFDLLLAPAVGEGHGRTLIEAMLAGVPVIAADSGGHREIVRHGETGLLTPPDDAAALAAAARSLLADAARRARLAAAGRRHAEALADPDRHARAIAALYRETVSAP